MKLYVGSRLHINSIDMNGSIGRCCGDLGLSIEMPRLVVKIMECGKENTAKEVREVVTAMLTRFALKKQYFRIEYGGIPEHSGLGSKTLLYLSIARLIANTNKINVSDKELAEIIQSGGYSGAGTGTFINKGGFVLTSGYSFGLGKNKYSFDEYSKKPPVIFPKVSFPLWPIVVAVPKNPEGLDGKIEQDFFKKITPVSLEEAREISHLTLMKLVPAIVEENYDDFLTAIKRICELGTKPHEKRINTKAKTVLKIMEKHTGFGGLSSLGATCYTFTRKIYEAVKLAAELEKNKDFQIIITTADNDGYVIRNGTHS